MSRGNKNKKDLSNLEKMKSEMRRKKQQAEELFLKTGIIEMTGIVEEGNPVVEAQEVQVAVIADYRLDLVVFGVGTEQFAFKMMNVLEIIRVSGLRTFPNAPEHVAGLCCLRGSAIPIIDIRKCFHMPFKEYDEDSRIIVVDIHGNQVGIITDRISNLASMEASAIAEPPSNIRNKKEGYISGIVIEDQGKGIIMVLDIEKLINVYQLNHAFARTESNSGGKYEVSALQTSVREKLVVFNIGIENYALNIKHVKEIVRYGELMSVPNSPHYVEGVLSIRNHLLAVINPGKIFGIQHHQIQESTRIIVVDAGAFSYGIVVENVSEVASVQRNHFYNPLRIVKSADMDFISEFAKLSNEKIVMVLDSNKLVSFTHLSSVYSEMKDEHHRIVPMNIEFTKEQFNLEKIVAFNIDEVEYGIGIDYVGEIKRLDGIVSLPGAPDFITGMVHLRGEIIPLVNLRALLGITEKSKLPPSMYLVVEYKKQRVGLIIDSVSEVIHINTELLEDIPQALLADNQKKYFRKICKLNEGKRTVMLVDLTEVLDFML